PPRELFLVVADDEGRVLGDEPPQTNRRGHLAVGEVMDDLARRPLPGRRPPVQLRLRRPLERRRHHGVAFLVLLHQPGSLCSRHRLSPFVTSASSPTFVSRPAWAPAPLRSPRRALRSDLPAAR